MSPIFKRDRQCPETSVSGRQPTQRNITEEWKPNDKFSSSNGTILFAYTEQSTELWSSSHTSAICSGIRLGSIAPELRTVLLHTNLVFENPMACHFSLHPPLQSTHFPLWGSIQTQTWIQNVLLTSLNTTAALFTVWMQTGAQYKLPHYYGLTEYRARQFLTSHSATATHSNCYWETPSRQERFNYCDMCEKEKLLRKTRQYQRIGTWT